MFQHVGHGMGHIHDSKGLDLTLLKAWAAAPQVRALIGDDFAGNTRSLDQGLSLIDLGNLRQVGYTGHLLFRSL